MTDDTTSRQTPATTPPETPPKPPLPRTPNQVYRGLIQKGISNSEAAKLTAAAFKLPVFTPDGKPVHWKLAEINKLLEVQYRTSKEVDGSYSREGISVSAEQQDGNGSFGEGSPAGEEQ